MKKILFNLFDGIALTFYSWKEEATPNFRWVLEKVENLFNTLASKFTDRDGYV